MKKFKAIGLACVALAVATVSLVTLACKSWAAPAEESQQAAVPGSIRNAELTDEQLGEKVAELRRNLPYESMAPRLTHERRRTKSVPRLTDDAARRLDELEKAYGGEDARKNVRAQSLAA